MIMGKITILSKSSNNGYSYADGTDGEKTMTKMWDGTEYKMPIETYRDMLAKIEQYASECQNATEKHLQAVEKLTTVEEVCDYDYTTGYPEMIDFDASSSKGDTSSAEGGGELG